MQTAVFISNDEDHFRDFQDLQLEVTFPGGIACVLADVPELPYGKTVRVPVNVVFPASAQPRQKKQMLLRLKQGSESVSETTDPVEIFEPTIICTLHPSVTCAVN